MWLTPRNDNILSFIDGNGIACPLGFLTDQVSILTKVGVVWFAMDEHATCAD